MKKSRIILIVAICFMFITCINAETLNLSEHIINIRNGQLTKLKDASNSSLNADKELKKDRDGNYVYSFGLGCNLNENCISSESVIYSGAVISTEYNGETITIDQAKEKWNNPDDNINPNDRWDDNGMNLGTVTFATESAKNNYSVIYKKMGKYNNKDIDVKMTLVDFENISIPKYTVSASAIVFTNNQIGINVTGIKWVKVKLDFIDSETGEAVIVKGNTTYWDIDQNQGVIFNNDSTNKGIYFSNQGMKCVDSDCTREEKVNNQLYYSLINSSDVYIFDQNSGLDSSQRNNLYNDKKNSLSYAISEEFEGKSIIRTIQYSNPVMINAASEENTWTGHGGLFLSSKNIEIEREKYRITTEAENGEIEDDITVSSGTDVTINYTPNEGYILSEIEVDGQKVSIEEFNNNYLFSNVNANHHIKVIYVKEETDENNEPDEIIQYKVTTEVENGEIDDDFTNVASGSDVTINYKPNKGYSLSEIIVDGKNVKVLNYKDRYTFENIQDNHHIKVIYINNPKTGILTPIIGLSILLIISTFVFVLTAKKQDFNSI